MKEKLLDYLLLSPNVYAKPLRKRWLLFLLLVGAGLVLVLGYSIQDGFTFIRNVFYIVMTIVLVLFSGIFASVMFCWPVSDLCASLSGDTGRINLTVKRFKVIKGFLLTVIYTGIISSLVMLVMELSLESGTSLASTIILIITSIWAGAMMTRCIFTVFSDMSLKKYQVFIGSVVLYYIVVVQIMGFIMKVAYSIIL